MVGGEVCLLKKENLDGFLVATLLLQKMVGPWDCVAFFLNKGRFMKKIFK